LENIQLGSASVASVSASLSASVSASVLSSPGNTYLGKLSSGNITGAVYEGSKGGIFVIRPSGSKLYISDRTELIGKIEKDHLNVV
jgi:hypothetical protein